MNEVYNNNLSHMLNKIMLGEEDMKKFDEFSEQYTDKSDRYMYNEIRRVQVDVSQDLKKQHLKNLEMLGKMEGFVTDETKEKINYVKRLINIDESSSSPEDNKESESQFFVGSSLLLWFLLATVLFRRKRFRRPFRRY